MAGDGPERPRLERLAAARAPGRVRFHGRLPKAEVLALVRSGTVLAVPSRSQENQPMVVLEAFACGVPVVTSALGGLPELVQPGRNGDSAPPEDPEALAAALDRLLGDPRRAFEMGVAARAQAQEEFTPAGHLRRLERLYAQAGTVLAALG